MQNRVPVIQVFVQEGRMDPSRSFLPIYFEYTTSPMELIEETAIRYCGKKRFWKLGGNVARSLFRGGSVLNREERGVLLL